MHPKSHCTASQCSEQNTQHAKWEMGTWGALYLPHSQGCSLATGLVGTLRSHSSQSKLFGCVLTAVHRQSWYVKSQKCIWCLCCATSERLTGYSFEEGFAWYYPKYSAFSVIFPQGFCVLAHKVIDTIIHHHSCSSSSKSNHGYM